MIAATEQPSRTLLPPPAPGVLPQLSPTMFDNRAGAASETWVLFESTRKGHRIQLTEQQMSVGNRHLLASAISDVAFWSPRAHHYRVHVEGVGPALSTTIKSHAKRTQGAAERETVAIVRWLEKRVFPRLVQARLQRLSLGLTVRVGRLELRESGLRWRGPLARHSATWAEFNHVVVTRHELVIVVRSARGGRLTTLARLPHNELNAVLLPALLPAAARTFTKI